MLPYLRFRESSEIADQRLEIAISVEAIGRPCSRHPIQGISRRLSPLGDFNCRYQTFYGLISAWEFRERSNDDNPMGRAIWQLPRATEMVSISPQTRFSSARNVRHNTVQTKTKFIPINSNDFVCSREDSND